MQDIVFKVVPNLFEGMSFITIPQYIVGCT